METEEVATQVSIVDKVRKLAEIQKAHTAARQELRRAQEAWELANKALFEKVQAFANLEAAADTMLRKHALDVYARTGNKAPGPGVGVRVTRAVQYDSLVALKWAKEHQMFLSLDKKEFESFARAAKAPPEFVKLVDAPQATVAGDLDAALAKFTPEASL